MSGKIPSNSKRNIVVVGGGYGASTARLISSKLDTSAFNLILIDPRPYRIHLIATARMVVSDVDHLSTTATGGAFAPLDTIFPDGKGTFVQAAVTAVEKNAKTQTGGSVTLDSGEKVPFDVLVLATGSKWAGPLDLPNSAEAIEAWLEARRKEFKDSESVVIAGGGAVGIELAGEIKDLWPSKPVTIVHSSSKLLNKTYPDKYRNLAEKSVVDRGIKVVLNDYVDDLTAKPVKTRSGKTLEGDLVVAAWGTRPNTSSLSSLQGDVLSANGFVKVKPSLQLQAHPEIFALGDILDIDEQKQAGKAEGHASIVAANVLSYITTGQTVKAYKGSYELIVITNGKEGGVAYMGVLWGLTFGAWFVRMVKSRDLLVSRFRAGNGL